MKEKDKHNRIKFAFKVTGIVLATAGAVLAVIGLVSFFSGFGTGQPPKLFWCAFLGLPMLGFGAMMLSLGFKREFSKYIKNETVPVINEAGQEIAPAVSAVAKAAKINTGEKEESDSCPFCGKTNGDGAQFCRHCGSRLYIRCPNCGESVKYGSYCDKCGAKLNVNEENRS